MLQLSRRFLVAVLVWTGGLFVLIVSVALLAHDSSSPAQFVRWLASAIGLAAFPAGIAIAPAIFHGTHPWRQVAGALLCACIVGAVVFLLMAFGVPMAGDYAMEPSQLWSAMRSEGDWETRNHSAWHFSLLFLAPFRASLFAAIGLQVGIWANRFPTPGLRRLLFWVVGLGLLVTGAGIFDTTYETIVLHTQAYVGFAALYTVLLPLSVCAGLALPTLALLSTDALTRRD